MNLLDMVWALFLLMLGGFMIELLFAKRSGVKAYQGIKQEVSKMPVVKTFKELFYDPNFDQFMAETIVSIRIFNELMRKIKKEGIGCLLK